MKRTLQQTRSNNWEEHLSATHLVVIDWVAEVFKKQGQPSS